MTPSSTAGGGERPGSSTRPVPPGHPDLTPVPAPPRGSIDTDVTRAEAARGMSFGLAGTTVAILTFTLFFLYPQRDQVNGWLFHATLDVIIVSLFGFGLAAYFYSRLMVDLLRQAPTVRRTLQRGNACLALAIGLLNLAPGLVLFTIGFWDVGILALVLWIALEAVVTRGRDAFEPILAGEYPSGN